MMVSLDVWCTALEWSRMDPDAIGERDCPRTKPSSIYPGSLVHRLHWDCRGIED